MCDTVRATEDRVGGGFPEAFGGLESLDPGDRADREINSLLQIYDLPEEFLPLTETTQSARLADGLMLAGATIMVLDTLWGDRGGVV